MSTLRPFVCVIAVLVLVIYSISLASVVHNISSIDRFANLLPHDEDGQNKQPEPAVATLGPNVEGFPKLATIETETCESVVRGSDVHAAFGSVYEKGVWGGALREDVEIYYHQAHWPPEQRRSPSGGGSNLGHATEGSLKFLKDVILEHQVSTMVDLPCGDANWIFESYATDSLKLYIGLDVTESIIPLNSRRFRHHSNKLFALWDGAACPVPRYRLVADGSTENPRPVDLVHSRDVIQHLPLERGKQFVCNIITSGAKYWVTTTYPSKVNRDIKLGEFYHNDLTAPPFNLPKEAANCTLTHPHHERDSTCLYDLQPDTTSGQWVKGWLTGNPWCQSFYTNTE